MENSEGEFAIRRELAIRRNNIALSPRLDQGSARKI
jgi:hypothetical protein